MVLSAGLLAGEALIPRTGTLAHHGFTVPSATLRNQTSCKSYHKQPTTRLEAVIGAVGPWPRRIANDRSCLTRFEGAVRRLAIIPNSPDLQTAKTLPDLICRTAPQRRARQNKNCCRATDLL
jgi:hypothetical protein